MNEKTANKKTFTCFCKKIDDKSVIICQQVNLFY